MPLFEVAVLSKPSKSESEDGVQAKLLHGPVAVVAEEEKGAIVAATKGITLPTSIEVLVRPFK
jgi:hypothetical protein